jgi:hypothetical protein
VKEMNLEEHMAYMTKINKNVVENANGNWDLGRSRLRQDDNTKTVIRWEDVK